MELQLRSPAFEDGQMIPKKYTEDGENISPPLAWDVSGEAVNQYALIMDDPDAPRDEPWVHWVLYAIPGIVSQLPEGLPRDDTIGDPPGTRQGLNSWGADSVGYRGPAPPPEHGAHHYHFRLFALSEPLILAGAVNRNMLLDAMKGCTIRTAELIGTYRR